jgi:hypothetical protein
MSDHDSDSERLVSQLLKELGSADPPPDFSRNVVWGIKNNHITIHRTRAVSNRNRIAMTRNAMWGLAAAATILLAVFVVRGVPPAGEGTEATIGAAQRYQAPQIEAKDVVVGDTSAQAVMQTETWDRIVNDETLRTLLQNASFRAQLQEASLRTALADSAVVRALQDPNLSRQLNNAELARSLNDVNLVKKIADTNLRTAMQNQAFLNALRNNDFRAQLADPRIAAALAGAAFQSALRDRGFVSAMGHERFSQALAARGGCDEFGCGSNSPIVDGARID